MKSRLDLSIISSAISENARVLDLGCGDGEFLKQLRQLKNIRPLGVENTQERVAMAIANGVPVIQGDLNSKLDFADDRSFDFVILSRTLQEVRYPDLLLREIVRVGRRALVSFINFGYWQCRFQLLLTGRMPKSHELPYEWYNTPNIHLGSLIDFRNLCEACSIRIVRETPLSAKHDKLIKFMPNLMAPGCVFEFEAK